MNAPFRESELRDMGMYPPVPLPYGMPPRPSRKYDTPITPRENILRICRREMPLWLPNLETDANVIQPEIMADAYARVHGGTDWFGIEWQMEKGSRAAMVKPGTRRLSDVTEWENELQFPDLSKIDWAADYEKNYAGVCSPDKATMFVIVNGCLERLADMTSFADTFCYLLEEPEAVEGLFARLTDFHIELMRIARDYYKADIITFHDDMGTQISSFMSPATFRELMVPHYQRMNRAAHEMGLYVNFHSCGCVQGLIPDYVNAGFDFWEGQDNCNDKQALMDAYGDKMGQVTMFFPKPDLTDEEYRQLILDRVHNMGKTGHYIVWFGDTKPGRSVNGAELIYKESRIMYCGKA